MSKLAGPAVVVTAVAAVLLSAGCRLAAAHEPFIVQFQWNYINYTWPSEEAYNKAEKDDGYIERNNVISGIKLYKGRMYLSIPRWRKGVPVTLAATSATPLAGQTAPLLEPFPSWDMQRLDDCSALQFVQGMEIDPKGRMWLLDSGRTNTLALEAKASCPPRLVLLDLEDNGAVLRSYEFPAEVARPDTAYLRDIVLDHEDGGLAYISDMDDKHPGIIVVSLENGTSFKVSHESMRAKPDAVGFIVEQSRVTKQFHVNGLALSPADTEGERVLYYAPLSSFNVFSVRTRHLKTEHGRADLAQHVQVLGRKPSQTDGMAMSYQGVLYFGLLGDDAVSMWDSRNPSFVTGQRIISRDHHLMQWPTSFAFDDKGQLWCITNRLHKFLDNTLDTKEPNFRAIMAKAGMKNYQYYENGTAPALPDIEAGASGPRGLALATLLAALLLGLLLQ